MRRLLFLLGLLGAVLFSSLKAETLEYSADKVVVYPGEKRITLQGNCRLTYAGAVMEADTVFYFMDEKRLLAMGNIDFSRGGQHFSGKTLEYDLELKRAYLDNGRAPVEKGYVGGEVINTVGESLVYGKNTSFTTCEHINPHFQIRSSRMKIIKNDKVLVSPVVFYVYRVPVFWFPALFFPIPEGRKTGFLIPTFSNNSVDGLTFQIPFFLVINKYSDLTYTLKIMAQRGLSHEGEFRLKTYTGEGEIDGAYTHDKLARLKRWYLKGSAVQDFPGSGVKLTLKADLLSDTSYYDDFSSNIDERTENSLSSYVTLEKNFGSRIYTRLLFSQENRWQDLGDGTTEEFVRTLLPGMTVNMYNIGLLPDMYLSLTGNSANLFEDNSFVKQASSGTVTLSYRHTLFSYLHMGERMVNRLDHIRYEERSIERWVPTFSTDLYFNLYGYFNLLGIGSTDTVKHTVKPSLSFDWTPERDQDRFAAMGESLISAKKQLHYRLDNTFLTKVRNNRKHLFLSLSTQVSQDLEAGEKSFSPVVTSAVFSPYWAEIVSTRLTFQHEYDSYGKETRYFSVYGTGAVNWEESRFNLSVFYRKGFQGEEDVLTSRIEGDIRLTKKWTFRTSILYDFNLSKIREQSFEFLRDLHCWNMGISWQERETGVIDYKFYIRLNAYGDFKWDYKGQLENET